MKAEPPFIPNQARSDLKCDWFISLGYTGTESAANRSTSEFSNSDGFGNILFSLSE